MEEAKEVFDLERFVSAQESTFPAALSELRSGRKRTHWMWFIFPQIEGLGSSSTARLYAIKSQAEAREYLAHPFLGPRLQEAAQALLAVEGRSAYEILGSPDDLKLQSSMTLFSQVAGPGSGSIFERVLEKYFAGRSDAKTLEILRTLA